MTIRQATLADFDGIRALLKANHVDYIPEAEKINGFVTTNMTDQQLTDLIEQEDGVTIAEENGRVIAFALAGPWSFWAQWPLFIHMIDLLPGYTMDGVTLTTENSYQYGPVCIEKAYRGTGLFADLFFASLAHMARRYPYMVTFVNQINPRSYAAHTRKAGMDALGTFGFNGNHYYYMACPTDSGR